MRSLNLLIKPVSSLCNMRCKYCFYADVAAHRVVKSYGMMSEETLEKLVKKVFESAAEMAVFTFQGGEPTLAGLSFYHRFIELQKKYNRNHISVFNTIQTNGYLIDETWAKFFAENSIKLGDITPDIVVPLETALSDIERYDAPESAYKKIVNGVPYPADDAPKGEFALYCRNELIGLATVVDGAVKIKTYLKGDLK